MQALSYGGIELEASRKLADIKKMDPMRIFVQNPGCEVYNGDYEVPVRLYFPTEEAMENGEPWIKKYFGHAVFPWRGLGNRECGELRPCLARMAQSTGQIVASVEYRLAPEHRFRWD